MRKEKERHAVILSGAGGYGSFEVGVLQALIHGESPSTGRVPLEAEILIGTSLGAYNATVLASRADLDLRTGIAHLEDVWLHRIAGGMEDNGVLRVRANPATLLDPRRLFRDRWRPVKEAPADAAFLSLDAGRRLAHFVTSKSSLVHRTLEMFDLSTLISSEPLETLLRETTPLEDLMRSHRTLKIAATNWTTGELRIFVHDPGRKEPAWQEEEEEGLTEGNWPGAVMASAAVPGIFPAVTLDGTPYLDGGVVMNTPLRPALRSGATVIHIVTLNPDARNLSVDEGPPSTLDIFERFLNLTVAAAVDDDIETARFVNKVAAGAPTKRGGKNYREITVHRYHPEIDRGGLAGMLDFERDTIQRRIEAGVRTALEHDCEQEGCVIPGRSHPGRKAAKRKTAAAK